MCRFKKLINAKKKDLNGAATAIPGRLQTTLKFLRALAAFMYWVNVRAFWGEFALSFLSSRIPSSVLKCRTFENYSEHLATF
jgi:hypothetical protein